EPGVVQMGRVLTVDRGVGLGGKLLKAGIEEIRARFHPAKIYIEAQSYAVGFYAREGFRVTSEEFLEDGIPHVKMELDL
ncbi:MAG: GNAT family N-acetyltransferase, partial [Clostridia bacterium]|nr:GNAT family N-acetyltransferase [Clostridia bacterium]